MTLGDRSTKAIQFLKETFDDFMQSFDKYKETDAFLELSRENLETFLSFENIPLDEIKIFECVVRWADNQCKIKYLEPTGENYREVLGSCLFEIRFPTMSIEEFTKVSFLKKNVLQADEQLAIYVFIGLDMDGKNNFDKSQLPFKTNRRVGVKLNRTKNPEKTPAPQFTNFIINPIKVNTSFSSGFSVLSLPPQHKISNDPSFVCDGSPHETAFQVNGKISLHGFGFLGPIDGDANINVTVQIRKWVKGSVTFNSGTFKKNIFAQKGNMFYFLLDEQIVVESNKYDHSWRNRYDINFSLKGPNNTSHYILNTLDGESFKASGVQFHLINHWDAGNPLAEFLFKKI